MSQSEDVSKITSETIAKAYREGMNARLEKQKSGQEQTNPYDMLGQAIRHNAWSVGYTGQGKV